MNTENTYYKIGEIVNPLPFTFKNIRPVFKTCSVSVPARIDTFLCNHHYFVTPPRPQVYPVCAINFVIDQQTTAEVSITDEHSDIELDANTDTDRAAIIRHTAEIMCKALDLNVGLRIHAKNSHSVRHGGFGSSAALQTSVALAINELCGSIIPRTHLIKFLAQNYGEECEKAGFLAPMASIGGASAAGISHASLIIIGGESEIWYAGQLPPEYSAVIAVPRLNSMPDGAMDMELFKKGFELFKEMGYEWGGIKEDILKNKIISGLVQDNRSSLFTSINMYTIGAYGNIPQYFRNRWLSHSIYMDSFIHDIYFQVFKDLSIHEHCFFVSSGGPSIAFITHKPDIVESKLQAFGSFTTSRHMLFSTGPMISLQ